MKTHAINTYSFNELPETAQQKALEKYRYWLVEDNTWIENILNDFRSILEEYRHFFDTMIEYSLANQCASFTGKILIADFIERYHLNKYYYKLLKKTKENQCILIIKRQQKDDLSEYSIGINYDEAMRCFDKGERILLRELARSVLTEVKILSLQIYRKLQQEYLYYTSNETIIETFNAQSYEFLLTGERFNEAGFMA